MIHNDGINPSRIRINSSSSFEFRNPSFRPTIILNHNDKSYISLSMSPTTPNFTVYDIKLPLSAPLNESLLKIDGNGQLSYSPLSGTTQTTILNDMLPIVSLSLRRINPNFNQWVLYVKKNQQFTMVYFDSNGLITGNSPTDVTTNGITFQTLAQWAESNPIYVVRWNNQFVRIAPNSLPLYFQSSPSTNNPQLYIGSGLNNDYSYITFNSTSNLTSVLNIQCPLNMSRTAHIVFRQQHTNVQNTLVNFSSASSWQYGTTDDNKIRSFWPSSTPPSVDYPNNIFHCSTLYHLHEGGYSHMLSKNNSNPVIYNNINSNQYPATNNTMFIGSSNSPFDLREFVFYHSYVPWRDANTVHNEICQYYGF